MAVDADKLPVIVGVGQLTSKVTAFADAPAPLEMLEAVSQRAAADAGLDSLRAVDTVASLPVFYWDEPNPAAALADHLKLDVRRTILTGDGGEVGVAALNWIAEQILDGRTGTALLVMSNNMKTVALGARAGVNVVWPGGGHGEPEFVHAGSKKAVADDEEALGIVRPIQFYPIIENAIRAGRGQTITEHREYLGRLFAPFTEVAARNPYAWFPTAYTPEQLITATPDNRMVCFPYTKRLNAVIDVDQAAALLVTSRGEARRLGIPEDKWVHWWGGADAQERAYYVSSRPNLDEAPGQADCHLSTLRNAEVTVDEIAAFDLYSCFPSAVQIAMKVLGLSIDDPRGLTVTGGLPYAGGPGTGYNIASLAAMTDRLRTAPADIGLVTGNGMYVSKHSATVLSVLPPRAARPASGLLGDLPSARMRTEPLPITRQSGRGVLDSYTVEHDRTGAPVKGVVVGRFDDGSRFVAATPSDAEFLGQFEAEERIGTTGQVREDGPVLAFYPD
jgi:acetyl-CoA C-acetyltransferase